MEIGDNRAKLTAVSEVSGKVMEITVLNKLTAVSEVNEWNIWFRAVVE